MNTYKKFILLSWIVGLSIVANVGYALPFIIQTKTGTTLPTEISSGQSVMAYLTVKNNTNTARKNNFVKWLPPNVTQVINSSLCGKKFDLPAYGHCTLGLSINGAVNANDPDPHHHLFVCFSDNTSCAGPQPNNALNVSILKNNVALAAGPYYAEQGYFPLAARSTNNGSSWSYPITANKPQSLPRNISPGPLSDPQNGTTDNYFSGSSCSGKLCAMAGRYLVGAVTYPMIALSKDGGITWSYPINSSTVFPGTMTPSNTNFAGVMNSIQCIGSLCAAAGQYHTVKGSFPLLALTLDAERTWSYPINALKLPNGAVAATQDGFVGNLQDVTCSGTHCLAVGQYNINATANNGKGEKYPLLALSTDSGTSWSYPLGAQSTYPGGISVNTSGFTAGFAGNFRRIKCVNQKCVLGGTYRSTGDLGTQNYTILGYSSNGGISWDFPISSQSNFPTNAISSSGFIDLDCDKNRCITGGYYLTNNTQPQLVMMSQNNGKTWRYVIQDGENLPVGTTSGYVNSVTCSGALCIAAGGYITTVGYPFVAQSKNGGLNWTYVVDKNHLPADAQPDYNQAVSMNSSSCATPYCMAGGYYFNGLGYFPLIAVTQNGGTSWNFPVTSKPSSLPNDALAEPSGFLFFFATAATSAGK